MKSMTGFGYTEFEDEKNHISINFKSYNNRYLDIVIFLPSYLGPLEQRLRNYLGAKVSRGRIELAIKSREMEEQIEVHLDKHMIGSYMEAFRELVNVAGLTEKINLSHLLRIDGLLKPVKNYDLEAYWNKIFPLLETTYAEFDKSRSIEGERTADFIKGLVSKISGQVDIIRNKIPEIEIKIKDQLKKRFHEIVGDEVAESKVLTETALMLIRFDIREEVARMTSHLETFSQTLAEGVAAGKKLDFLCQELNREINTVGSKSIFLEVNNAVIAVKDAVETIREQLRNVE